MANQSSATLPPVEDVPAGLFKDHKGEPIHFHMYPCSERAKLKPYVVAGGGLLNYGSATDQSITLVAPTHIATKVSRTLLLLAHPGNIPAHLGGKPTAFAPYYRVQFPDTAPFFVLRWYCCLKFAWFRSTVLFSRIRLLKSFYWYVKRNYFSQYYCV